MFSSDSVTKLSLLWMAVYDAENFLGICTFNIQMYQNFQKKPENYF